ncbi:MAG: HlyC/CorC family transporter [Myxococcaceae bacterium]|nr:HlyC/CorC family transporter [Myxococcaceae bacterium]
MNTAAELGIVAGLSVLNGVLSGAEIAIVAARKTNLEQLAREGSGAAKAVLRLREQPERFLATVQVGITVIGASAGAYGGAAIADDLSKVVARVPLFADHAWGIAFGISIVVVSYLSLVIGELVPKSLALRSAEPYALLMGRPLWWLSVVARPIVWFLTASSNLVLKPFRDETNFTEARLSAKELKADVEAAAASGSVDPQAGEIASRALDLAELTAADVMIPRTRVVALHADTPVDEAVAKIVESGHQRVLVHEGDVDHVIGQLSLRDAVGAHGRGPLRSIVQPVISVTDTQRGVDVLGELQRRDARLAVVVDPHGLVAGLVTRDDLMRELMGERLRSTAAPIRPQADGSALVLGTVPVRQINRELGFHLPDEGEFSTIAGLFLTLAQHIPAPGEMVQTVNGFTLQVIAASRRRVRALRIVPPAQHPA